MDLWEALVILVRRWYVTLPLLALTAAGILLVGGRVEPTYRASAALIFVGPNQVDIGDEGEQVLEFTNPFLRFSGSIQTTARAIVLAVSSGRTAAALVDEGLSSDYEVGVEARNPIISIEARHDDPGVTLATLDRVIELIQADLATRQDAFDAPPAQRIGLQVLAQPDQAQASFGARNRLRIVGAVLGLALTVGVAFAVEGLARLRRKRRQAAVASMLSAFDEAALGSASGEPVGNGVTVGAAGGAKDRPDEAAARAHTPAGDGGDSEATLLSRPGS